MNTPDTISRHDFTQAFHALVSAAIQHKVLDAVDLIALGASCGTDYHAMTDYIVSCAFNDRHTDNSKHQAICPLADAVYAREDMFNAIANATRPNNA